MLNDALCSAPKQNVLETSVAVRGHDDQISRNFLCEFANFMKWSRACSEVRLFLRRKSGSLRDAFKLFGQLPVPILFE